ncbi:hypothetical protein [Streptomyces sp. DH10]|uniref:hypothetical protein n=1 Tax=Streptomyces sp. DH10 TaxID=3040121 RepID=UPI002441748D|nr:hypothetical protein [Streptomyces sp. DH10]MDG9711173.1 hypothetical protein [Streptomyces sp. DH10]
MNLAKALEMIAPFKSHPHYAAAVWQLEKAQLRGKRELSKAAYRIRNAYTAYDYAVNYGKNDEGA